MAARCSWVRALLTVTATVAFLGGCGNGSDSGDDSSDAGEPGTTATEETTAPELEVVTREEVVACLDEAGLDPQDSGVFIIGSESTNVEAIGLTDLGEAGQVLVYVFDEDAAGEVDYVADTAAAGYGEVANTGNVVVAYQFSPADEDRALIDACLPGSDGRPTTTEQTTTSEPADVNDAYSRQEQVFLETLGPVTVPYVSEAEAIESARAFCVDLRGGADMQAMGFDVALVDPVTGLYSTIVAADFARAATQAFCPEFEAAVPVVG